MTLANDAPTLEYHPLANIFPIIEGKEFDDLVADIRAHGVREPIWLYEGKVIDGRNRHRASIEAGADCPMRTYDGADPVRFVISLNLHRRHLNESQRAMAHARIATLPKGVRADTAIAVSVPTQQQAARLLNISVDSGQRARRLIEDGAHDLVAKVERGEVSVSAAAEVATLPKEEQAVVITGGDAEIVRRANQIKREKKEKRREERKAEVATRAADIAPASHRFRLFNERCGNALELGAASVDWIITDPPYPEEFLPAYTELAAVAQHVLKPGASLLCMVGQAHLPEVIDRLTDRLNYHWTLAYMTPGGQAASINARSVNSFWKPVLWLTNGKREQAWIGDVAKSDVNDNDKSRHHWGQSESGMADLMRRFVKPGDVVLDPFMGAGTTGVVALSLGASFVGYDVDAHSYNETLVRLGDAKLAA